MKRFGLCLAAAASSLAMAFDAHAEPPTCGAPAAIDILRDQARAHFSFTKSTGQSALEQLNRAAMNAYIPNGDFDIQVDEMFAVSRLEDVRECRAMMHLVEPGRVSGESPVFYSVTRSEDGHDLVAINGGQALYLNLLKSLEANNSDVRDRLNAFRRDVYRSASDLRNVMPAKPDLNRPPPSYPSSSFDGDGNLNGRSRRYREDD